MEAELCPEVAAGDLVITEVRGPQPRGDAPDTGGQWIEIYNRSAATVDLLGMHVRLRTLDGANQPTIVVRESVPVVAGGYVVLGGSEEVDAPPSSFDYNWYPDFSSADSDGDLDELVEDRDLFGAAAIDLEACGVRIDRMVYEDLPAAGTYALGGEPDAERNDDAGAWCTDATSDDTDPATVGLPGTPGSENPPCA